MIGGVDVNFGYADDIGEAIGVLNEYKEWVGISMQQSVCMKCGILHMIKN